MEGGNGGWQGGYVKAKVLFIESQIYNQKKIEMRK